MTLDTPLFLAVCVIPILALVAVSVLVFCCCQVIKRRKKQKEHLDNVARRIEERRRRHSDSSSVVSHDRHSWTAAFRHRHLSGPPYHAQCTWPATWAFVNDLESLRARTFYQHSRGATSGRPSCNPSIAIELTSESGLPLSAPPALAPVDFAVAPPYTSITIDSDGPDEAPPPYEEIFGSCGQLHSPPPSYNSDEGEQENNPSFQDGPEGVNTQI